MASAAACALTTALLHELGLLGQHFAQALADSKVSLGEGLTLSVQVLHFARTVQHLLSEADETTRHEALALCASGTLTVGEG